MSATSTLNFKEKKDKHQGAHPVALRHRLIKYAVDANNGPHFAYLEGLVVITNDAGGNETSHALIHFWTANDGFDTQRSYWANFTSSGDVVDLFEQLTSCKNLGVKQMLEMWRGHQNIQGEVEDGDRAWFYTESSSEGSIVHVDFNGERPLPLSPVAAST